VSTQNYKKSYKVTHTKKERKECSWANLGLSLLSWLCYIV